MQFKLEVLITSFNYLKVMIPTLIIGVIAAEFLVNMGWINKIAWLAKPITRFGHLRSECGVCFVSAFASPTAANAMLVEFYEKGLLDKKGLILASLINSFPAIVMHFRSMLPVLIPILGFTGLIYFMIIVAIGLVKTSLVLIAARFLLKKRTSEVIVTKAKKTRPPLKEVLKTSVTQSMSTIRRVLLITIPVTVVVFWLVDLGVFDKLAVYLGWVAGYFPIPAEGLPIIAAQFGQKIAAYTIAANLMTKGIISPPQVILTLLVGSVVTAVVGIRYLIPYYVGVFGAKNGFQLLLLSSGIRISVIIMFIIILPLVWYG